MLLSIDEKSLEKISFKDLKIASLKFNFSSTKVPPYDNKVFIKDKTRSTQRMKP